MEKRKKTKSKNFFLKKYINGKAAVFIDYANIKSWTKDKNLFIDLEILYTILKRAGVNKIFFYYGTDPKNPSIFSFFTKLRSFGFEVITKPVKYLKINLLDLINKRVNQEFINKLTSKTRKKLILEVKNLEKQKIKLLFPKANFDVEITLDMLLFLKNFDTFILFSGDGDFVSVLKYLRSKNKKVIVISGRKFLAGDLIQTASAFITLERFLKRKKGLFTKARPLKKRS